MLEERWLLENDVRQAALRGDREWLELALIDADMKLLSADFIALEGWARNECRRQLLAGAT